jgi:hypothetical protein
MLFSREVNFEIGALQNRPEVRVPCFLINFGFGVGFWCLDFCRKSDCLPLFLLVD